MSEVNTSDNNEDESEGEEESIHSGASSKEVTPEILTFEDAASCLDTLGKCDSGLGYAYLSIKISKRHLTDISVLPKFKHVLYVNACSNKLTWEAIKPLLSMQFLLVLELDRNDLCDSFNFGEMPYLQTITLNNNKITEVSELLFPRLQILELKENKISSIFINGEILRYLRVLELRGNSLPTTQGIFAPSLVKLYLAENDIMKIEGLVILKNLEILHLRSNAISDLSGCLEGCSKLMYLNLRKNWIGELNELGGLKNLTGLKVLILSENPLPEHSNDHEQEEDDRGEHEDTVLSVSYRLVALAVLPNLIRIDKQMVSDEERRTADVIRKQLEYIR